MDDLPPPSAFFPTGIHRDGLNIALRSSDPHPIEEESFIVADHSNSALEEIGPQASNQEHVLDDGTGDPATDDTCSVQDALSSSVKAILTIREPTTAYDISRTISSSRRLPMSEFKHILTRLVDLGILSVSNQQYELNVDRQVFTEAVIVHLLRKS